MVKKNTAFQNTLNNPDELDKQFKDPEVIDPIGVDDYVNVAPNVTATDYYIAANYKPVDYSKSGIEVESNMYESFIHGLTVHNAGAKPNTFASMSGLSYLMGTLLPFSAMHKVAGAVASRVVGRVALESGPYRAAQPGFGLADDLLRNQRATEIGTRWAGEAGLWTAADPELEGPLGYRDALMYTGIGEGLAFGIGSMYNKIKNRKAANAEPLLLPPGPEGPPPGPIKGRTSAKESISVSAATKQFESSFNASKNTDEFDSIIEQLDTKLTELKNIEKVQSDKLNKVVTNYLTKDSNKLVKEGVDPDTVKVGDKEFDLEELSKMVDEGMKPSPVTAKQAKQALKTKKKELTQTFKKLKKFTKKDEKLAANLETMKQKIVDSDNIQDITENLGVIQQALDGYVKRATRKNQIIKGTLKAFDNMAPSDAVNRILNPYYRTTPNHHLSGGMILKVTKDKASKTYRVPNYVDDVSRQPRGMSDLEDLLEAELLKNTKDMGKINELKKVIAGQKMDIDDELIGDVYESAAEGVKPLDYAEKTLRPSMLGLFAGKSKDRKQLGDLVFHTYKGTGADKKRTTKSYDVSSPAFKNTLFQHLKELMSMTAIKTVPYVKARGKLLQDLYTGKLKEGVDKRVKYKMTTETVDGEELTRRTEVEIGVQEELIIDTISKFTHLNRQAPHVARVLSILRPTIGQDKFKQLLDALVRELDAIKPAKEPSISTLFDDPVAAAVGKKKKKTTKQPEGADELEQAVAATNKAEGRTLELATPAPAGESVYTKGFRPKSKDKDALYIILTLGKKDKDKARPLFNYHSDLELANTVEIDLKNTGAKMDKAIEDALSKADRPVMLPDRQALSIDNLVHKRASEEKIDRVNMFIASLNDTVEQLQKYSKESFQLGIDQAAFLARLRKENVIVNSVNKYTDKETVVEQIKSINAQKKGKKIKNVDEVADEYINMVRTAHYNVLSDIESSNMQKSVAELYDDLLDELPKELADSADVSANVSQIVDESAKVEEALRAVLPHNQLQPTNFKQTTEDIIRPDVISPKDIIYTVEKLGLNTLFDELPDGLTFVERYTKKIPELTKQDRKGIAVVEDILYRQLHNIDESPANISKFVMDTIDDSYALAKLAKTKKDISDTADFNYKLKNTKTKTVLTIGNNHKFRIIKLNAADMRKAPNAPGPYLLVPERASAKEFKTVKNEMLTEFATYGVNKYRTLRSKVSEELTDKIVAPGTKVSGRDTHQKRNYRYAKNALEEVIDKLVRVETFKQMGTVQKSLHIPATKAYINELKNVIETAGVRNQLGNLESGIIIEEFDNLLRNKGFDVDRLPDKFIATPRGNRAKQVIQEEMEVVGDADAVGAPADDLVEIEKKEALGLMIGENLETIVGKEGKTKLTDTYKEIEDLVVQLVERGDASRVTTDARQLKVLADVLKLETKIPNAAKTLETLRAFYKPYEEAAIIESRQAGKYMDLEKLTPEELLGNKELTNAYKAYDSVITPDVIKATDELLKREKFYEDMQVYSYDDLFGSQLTQENKVAIRQYQIAQLKNMIRQDGAAWYKDIEKGMYETQFNEGRQGLLPTVGEEMPQILRTDMQTGAPVSPTRVDESRLYNTQWQELKKIQDPVARDMAEQALETAYVNELINSPALSNQLMRSMGLTNQVPDFLFHSIRYLAGDEYAGQVLRDMTEFSQEISKLNTIKLDVKMANPAHEIRQPTLKVMAGDSMAKHQDHWDDIGKDIHQGGGDGFNGTYVEPVRVGNVAAQLINDPGYYFQKGYTVTGDSEWLRVFDKGREFAVKLEGSRNAKTEFDKTLGAPFLEFVDTLSNGRFRNRPEEFRQFVDDVTKLRYDIESAVVQGRKNYDKQLKKQIRDIENSRLSAEDKVKARNLIVDKHIGDDEKLVQSMLAKAKQSDKDKVEFYNLLQKHEWQITDIQYNKEISDELMLRHARVQDAVKALSPDDAAKFKVKTLNRVGYRAGYAPRLTEGAFKLRYMYSPGKTGVKGKYDKFLEIGSVTSKDEIEKAIRTYNKNNPEIYKKIKESGNAVVQVRPSNRLLSVIKDTEFSRGFNDDFNIGVLEIEDALNQKVSDDISFVDRIFRQSKRRDIQGPTKYTPRQELAQQLNQQFYNARRSAEFAKLETEVMELVLKHKDTQPELVEYAIEWLNMLGGKKTGFERTMDNVANSTINLFSKIPGTKAILDKMNLSPGGVEFRQLSNSITAISSFAALGFNPATALLQYTILGLNVIPMVMANGGTWRTIEKGLRQGLKGKKGKYAKLMEKSGIYNLDLDGAVNDVLSGININPQGPSRKFINRIREWSMFAFQKADTQSRQISLVMYRELADDIFDRVLKQHKKTPLNSANFRKNLNMDQQIMFKQMVVNNVDLATLKKTDDIYKELMDDFAIRAMENTNHTYNRFNNPLAFANPVTRPFLQFKTWVQKEIGIFFRAFMPDNNPSNQGLRARYRQGANITAAFLMMGGLFSLPGAQELDAVSRWAFGVSPKAWFYGEDSPWMDILAGGLFTAVGINLDGRTGPGSVTTLASLENSLGIFPARIWNAGKAFREGKTDQATNYLMPRFMQSIKRSYDLATTGKLHNTYNGGVLFDLEDLEGSDFKNIMLTLMGLQTKEEMIFHTTKFGLISKGQANKRQRTRGMQKVIQLLESGKNVQAKQLADSLGIDFTQAKNRAKKLAEEAYKGLSISYLKKDEVEEAYTRFR